MSDMSFLILGYYYPPMKAVGVLRMYYLSSALAGKGYPVTVISTKNSFRLQQEPVVIPEAIEVLRVQTLDYRSLRFQRDRKVHFHESAKSGRAGRLAVRVMNSFPFNLLIGEGGLIYTLQAYRHAKKQVREKNITHVISSFRPYADHVVGYLLKRKYPYLHWTADFRDIHVDSIKGNVLWPSLQHWINKRLLHPADLVTTVSAGCKKELDRYHNNVRVVYNGVPAVNTVTQALRSKFTLSYTGSLYGELRSPAPVFDAISNLLERGELDRKHLEICYAGKDSEAWRQWIDKYHLEDISADLGLIGIDEAKKLQEQSHINLLLTFAEKNLTGALTAKVFEYLAASRPILTVINGSLDPEIRQLIEAHQAGSVFATQNYDPARVEAVLKEYYKAWLQDDMEVFRIHSPKLKEILWTRRIDEFLSLLENHGVRRLSPDKAISV